MIDHITPLTNRREKSDLEACGVSLMMFFRKKLMQVGFYTPEYRIRKQQFEEVAIKILNAKRIAFIPKGLYGGPAELQIELFKPFVKSNEGWRSLCSWSMKRG